MIAECAITEHREKNNTGSVHMPVAEYILPAISLIVGLNARAIGMRLGLIDYPLRGHKTHKEPTPLVGGIAVALPLLTYCTLFWWTHPESLGHAAQKL